MNVLTSNEGSFRSAKLVAYKAFADLAGKGALFVDHDRRGAPAVAAGVRRLLARVDARMDARGGDRFRDSAASGPRGRARSRPRPPSCGVAARAAVDRRLGDRRRDGLLAAARSAGLSVPVAVLALVYACSGLIELLHYFYRGLSRSDVESSLTLWQRSATLVSALDRACWWPGRDRAGDARCCCPVLATLAVEPADRDAPCPHLRRRRMLPTAQSPKPGAAWPDHVPARRAADRRRHRAVGALLPDRCVPVQLWSGTRRWRSTTRYSGWSKRCGCFRRRCWPWRCPLCRAADLRPLVRVSAGVTRVCRGGGVALWAAAPGWCRCSTARATRRRFRRSGSWLLSFPLMSLNYALTHQLIGWNGQRAYAAMCAPRSSSTSR